MAGKPEFQRRLDGIEELIGKIEDGADTELRAASHKLVGLVMDLHATALERTLEMLRAAGEPGRQWIEMLGQDDLVSSLLVLHGLHPVGLEDRVERAVEKIRPSLNKRGGAVELLSIEDGVPRLRLRAKEHAAALRELLEDAVYQAAPDVTSVLIESVDEPAGFVPLSALRSTPSMNGHAHAQTGKGGL